MEYQGMINVFDDDKEEQVVEQTLAEDPLTVLLMKCIHSVIIV